MHIPDGFLSTPVWSAFDLLAIPAIGLVARRAQTSGGTGVEDGKLPLLGVMGAFVFAAQMINFPVAAGTSGHLVGGALLAIALGPAPAMLVMTAILAIQAFVFQDGGIMALGANIFNMAIVGVLAGYLPYKMLAPTSRSAAIFVGGVLSVTASGMLALSELTVSGVPMPRRLLFFSLGVFVANALIEGAITLVAVRAIDRLNPAILNRRATSPLTTAPSPFTSPAFAIGAIAALILALSGILLASTRPDGIEKLLAIPIAASPTWIRRVLAGLGGIAMAYALSALAAKFILKRRSWDSSESSRPVVAAAQSAGNSSR
jgi:cobalt/nickel transport system permease protein